MRTGVLRVWVSSVNASKLLFNRFNAILLRECYGQKPSVERFGYRNLATFMRQYPDYFIEVSCQYIHVTRIVLARKLLGIQSFLSNRYGPFHY